MTLIDFDWFSTIAVGLLDGYSRIVHLYTNMLNTTTLTYDMMLSKVCILGHYSTHRGAINRYCLCLFRLKDLSTHSEVGS
jgi:hypothetical protein